MSAINLHAILRDAVISGTPSGMANGRPAQRGAPARALVVNITKFCVDDNRFIREVNIRVSGHNTIPVRSVWGRGGEGRGVPCRHAQQRCVREIKAYYVIVRSRGYY